MIRLPVLDLRRVLHLLAIKVPMFPFHTWLPAAHVEAPTAGSVILASVLLKMGTYGSCGLPADRPYGTHVFAPYVLWLSVIGILYGGFARPGQSDLKKLVAYSWSATWVSPRLASSPSTRTESRAPPW